MPGRSEFAYGNGVRERFWVSTTHSDHDCLVELRIGMRAVRNVTNLLDLEKQAFSENCG
jgi:hypothetical protein